MKMDIEEIDYTDLLDFLDEEETYLEQLFFDLDFDRKYMLNMDYRYYDDYDDNMEDNVSIK
jgi:hypothetical protein